MAKKIYRAAIIGCGRIASLLEDDPLRGKPASHAGALSAHSRTRIVAGCDIDPDRLKTFGLRWGVKKLYTDYNEMFEKERLDIVSVALWTHLHSDAVISAARSGKVKGIYCEKPIAVNLPQAKRMLKACEENRVAMVVGHERRWDRRYQVIRQMLSDGELGELRSITGYVLSSEWPKISRRKYGGGPMFHDGTHMVDLFRYFGGEVTSVTAQEERMHGENSVESSVTATLNFANGATGQITGGGRRDYFHFELDAQTDKSRVIIGNHGEQLFTTGQSERYTGFHELGQVPFPETGIAINPFVGGVADLIREMETGKKSSSSGEDGYKALEIITAMYRSAKKGGVPVKLPL